MDQAIFGTLMQRCAVIVGRFLQRFLDQGAAAEERGANLWTLFLSKWVCFLQFVLIQFVQEILH